MRTSTENMHRKLLKIGLLFFLSFVLAAPAFALNDPFLIKDINTTPALPSEPSGFVELNGAVYFSATTDELGAELWKSDGTTEGTVLVKDIFAEAGCSFRPCSSAPSFLANVNGVLYFAADDGVSGMELWKSDGTEAGTVLVKDIRPGTYNSNPMLLTDVNGVLYFLATDGVSGMELWTSNGTEAGTVMVKDITPGAGGSEIGNLTSVDGVLFFAANNGTSGYELWTSDGTAAGTVMVKDINPGAGGSIYAYLADLNGVLYFTATNGSAGYELWKSDGTAAGTSLAKDIYPGMDSSFPTGLLGAGGFVYFMADDGEHGNELWGVNVNRTAGVGVFRSGTWYLDANRSLTWDGSSVDVLGIFGVGLANAVPVTGDWTGEGTTKIGVFNNGTWYLDVNDNRRWDGNSIDILSVFGAGVPSAVPVAGDWSGTGTAKIGIFTNGVWYLDLNGNGAWDNTPTDGKYLFGGGVAGALPVAGDWSGTGIAKIGIFANGVWYLDLNGNGAWDNTPTDGKYTFGGGVAWAVPVTGDWNGDGTTEIGIYANGVWYIDLNGNGVWDDMPIDGKYSFDGGVAGAIPVTGNW